jgi:hypothetical protein
VAPAGAAPAADLTALAATDRRVARELAAAERERLAAAQRAGLDDAAADRRLRVAEGQLRLTEQRDEAKARQRERRQAQAEAARVAKRARKQARRKARKAWIAERVDYVRDNAPAVYSSVIYGLAVGGAVYGQVDGAVSHDMPVWIGLVSAAAIEGTGLAMALTANQQRLTGERALAARSMTWLSTATAVAIQVAAHADNTPKALGLSALSALGIVVWEIRSGAKHRPTLRKAGQIPDPPDRFGWRRWLRYPRSTWAAWSIDIRDRLSPGAADLVARAETQLADRAERRAAHDGARKADAVRAEVRRVARLAARKAARKGETGAALTALMYLARVGEPAPAPVLPVEPAPVDADVAELCALVRRQAATARVRLIGSTPPRHPFMPAHHSTHPAPTGPARKPAQPPADEPRRRRATEPGEPAQAPTREPPSEPAHEPGSSARAGDGESTRRGRRESRRRPAPARVGRARRLTVTANTDPLEVLTEAYEALMRELGREPSGAELATRAQCSKATANRWKSTRPSSTR